MEAVKQFNQELSSLYEIKPPISKAKMTAITKGAIRAIKYYKHVVQSVEKFIQKCRPEYKIPGLYVIDSIVRQSRHQFGAAKDVFAPRFAKNVLVTFYHLYKCAEEEKSRVIRVLNLWQKNEVFTADIIQPLFDLANSGSDLHRQVEEQVKRGENQTAAGGKAAPKAGSIQVVNQNNSSGGNQNSGNSEFMSELDAGDQQVMNTIQQFLRNMPSSGGGGNSDVKFNKKLLDFDYSDDEDGGGGVDFSEPTPQMLDALSNILGNDRLLGKLKAMGEITPHHIQQLQQLLPQMHTQTQQQNQYMWPPQAPQNPEPPQINSSGGGPWHSAFQQQPPIDDITIVDDRRGHEDDIQIVDDRGGRGGRDGGRGGDGGRDGGGRGGRGSRSPRGDRKRSRSHRSRSRSRDRSSRSRRRSRSREREAEREREKRREREKKGLPPVKKAYLSVCSTTLWVGHLSKLVADEDLSDLFGEYGMVESINLIPPRGCAFVHMNRRMDAYKALKELHKHKLHGKPITIAWAPGKGLKDKQWKDCWDVALGVAYIPLDKLDPQTDLASLEDGGTFDDETMPDWMKNVRGNAHSQQQPLMTEATALGMPLQAAVDPALAALHGLALPPGPPPGMAPFGLPPGIPPGALAAPGILGGIMPPRFGPPPGFPPSFDTSQPPPGMGGPGMRMPGFPPQGHPGGHPQGPPGGLGGPGGPPNILPNVEGQGDVEMEIEDQDGGPRQSPRRGGPPGGPDDRDRNNRRDSRGRGGFRDGPPGGPDSDRGTPDRGGRQEEGLQSRLARLAGQQPGNNDRDDSNPRSLMDMDRFDGPPQDRDQEGGPRRGGGPPFGGTRGGPPGPFENSPGGPPGPRFGGPEPFNNGPPFGRDGPFNDSFEGPPFRGGRGGFDRGGRGGFDRGRGGFDRDGPRGRGGRGGFRDGPPGPGGPGPWRDDHGGPPGGPFGQGPDRDQGFGGPDRGGFGGPDRGGFGGRGRGDRGGRGGFDRGGRGGFNDRDGPDGPDRDQGGFGGPDRGGFGGPDRGGFGRGGRGDRGGRGGYDRGGRGGFNDRDGPPDRGGFDPRDGPPRGGFGGGNDRGGRGDDRGGRGGRGGGQDRGGKRPGGEPVPYDREKGAGRALRDIDPFSRGDKPVAPPKEKSAETEDKPPAAKKSKEERRAERKSRWGNWPTDDSTGGVPPGVQASSDNQQSIGEQIVSGSEPSASVKETANEPPFKQTEMNQNQEVPTPMQDSENKPSHEQKQSEVSVPLHEPTASQEQSQHEVSEPVAQKEVFNAETPGVQHEVQEQAAPPTRSTRATRATRGSVNKEVFDTEPPAVQHEVQEQPNQNEVHEQPPAAAAQVFGGPEPSAIQNQEAFEEPAHVHKEVFNEQPPERHHQEVFEQPLVAAVTSQPEPVFEKAAQEEVFEPPQRTTRATRTSKRNQQQEVQAEEPPVQKEVFNEIPPETHHQEVFEQPPASQPSEVFEQPAPKISAPVFEPAPSFEPPPQMVSNNQENNHHGEEPSNHEKPFNQPQEVRNNEEPSEPPTSMSAPQSQDQHHEGSESTPATDDQGPKEVGMPF